MDRATQPGGRVRVALCGPPGIRDKSLLALLEEAGCLTVRDASDPALDVVVLHHGEAPALDHARLRLFGSPSIPVIVVTSDGGIEVYEKRRTSRASAVDLVAAIAHVTAGERVLSFASIRASKSPDRFPPIVNEP